MNQAFSLTRFARLHRWLWAIKRRTYLAGAAALLLVALLYLSRVLRPTDGLFEEEYQTRQMLSFLIASLLVMSAIGCDVFSALFRQESALTYLMLPASRAEKFWLGATYCLVAFALLVVVYFGLEVAFFGVANAKLKAGQTRYVSSLLFFGPGGRTNGSALYATPYIALLTIAASLLGSFFFRRGVFVRSSIIALLTLTGFYLIYQFVLGLQFPGAQVHTGLPFMDASIEDKQHWIGLQAPRGLSFLMYGLLLLMLWIIARVRFNEIER